jgi:hypothetical protein
MSASPMRRSICRCRPPVNPWLLLDQTMHSVLVDCGRRRPQGLAGMEVEIRCAGGGGAGWPVGTECDAGPESRFNPTPHGVQAFGEVASPRGPVRGCVGRRRRRRPRSPRLPLLAGPSSSQRRATPRRARQPAPCPALAHAHRVHVGHRGAPAVGTKRQRCLSLRSLSTVLRHQPLTATGPSRQGPGRRCAGGGSPMALGGPWQGATRRPTARSATAHTRKGSPGERRGMGGGPGRGSSPRSSRLAPDGHLDRLDAPGTPQDGVGGGLADGQHHVVSPGMAAGSCCKLVRTARRSPGKAGRRAGNRAFRLSPAAGVTAVMAWWGVLQARVVQLRHRTKVGAGWRQPSRAPRQRPPAVTVMGRCVSGGAAFHRPLGPPQPVQLRRQRPGAVLQVLQVAVAVDRPPVDLARPAAPVAGLRSARTGVVGLGPAGAAAALPEPGSGRDGDLPGPADLPAGHQVSPPWPGCRAPTNPPSQHGTAGPGPHLRGSPTLSGRSQHTEGAGRGQCLASRPDPSRS